MPNEAGGPSRAPGLEPSRTIDLTQAPPESHVVDPATLAHPEPGAMPTPGVMETSTPPGDPDLTARFAAQEEQIKELQRGISRMTQQHEDAIEEAQLNREMDQLMASAVTPATLPRPNGDAMYALPDGQDPNAPATVGQVTTLMRNFGDAMGPSVQAYAMQAAWDVTAEEVQALFQERPELQNIPEPNRTLAIRKAVPLLRKRRARAAAPAGSPTSAAGPETPAAPTRDLAPGSVTPHVERPRAAPPSPSEESGPADQVGRLTNAYAKARYDAANTRDLAEKKRLLAQMKIIHNQLAAVQGLTDRDLQEGWQQGGGNG